MNNTLMLGLALFVSLPTLAIGQERGRVPNGPRPFNLALNRGRIGIIVNTDADAEMDRVGARIEAVSPGGPADHAGLRAGDVITRFNSVALTGGAGNGRESGPGVKLVRLAGALEPGDTARIEYRRGNEGRTATVVAADVPNPWDLALSMPSMPSEPPDVRRPVNERLPGASLWGSPWLDLELVRLNSELGEYFGTREGILVVQGARDESLPLMGGDVILTIDDRQPTTPGHTMRILRSYAPGEKVRIEILRKQKRQTLTWTVRERAARPYPGERRGSGAGGVGT